MTLNIISAEKIEFTGTVKSVALPGEIGLFTVLENHAALLASLVAGTLTFQSDGKEDSIEIKGGIVDVNNNIVSVCLY